ncbi:MAG: LysM peptidoglycan-binding domain-containing protein [Planctomycetia bacterium]|nr:LysM peptidoglycan-binding domain-containing protein [Planctomycetia bacterium]
MHKPNGCRVSNTMENYSFMTLAVVGTMVLSFFIGGCAVQPKKSKVPAPLESEIKSIEGQKSSTEFQRPVPGEKTTYVVKKGDTLWSISKKYGVSVDTMLRANHITNTKDLKVGQKLIIPMLGKTDASSSFVSRSIYAPATRGAGGASSRGFIWPVKGQIVSQFGEMRNGTKNAGICIVPQAEQKIVAAKKGVIEAVSDSGDGMSVIVIKHEGGIRTIYEGRCSPVVGEGGNVAIGQPIANINSTGTGKPPEIKFKVYVKDKPANPMTYLP